MLMHCDELFDSFDQSFADYEIPARRVPTRRLLAKPRGSIVFDFQGPADPDQANDPRALGIDYRLRIEWRRSGG
jgi:hypothetical protein